MADLLRSPDVILDPERLLRGEAQQDRPQEWIVTRRFGASVEDLAGRPHPSARSYYLVVRVGCNFPNCPCNLTYEATERDLRVVAVDRCDIRPLRPRNAGIGEYRGEFVDERGSCERSGKMCENRQRPVCAFKEVRSERPFQHVGSPRCSLSRNKRWLGGSSLLQQYLPRSMVVEVLSDTVPHGPILFLNFLNASFHFLGGWVLRRLFFQNLIREFVKRSTIFPPPGILRSTSCSSSSTLRGSAVLCS